MGLRRPPYVFTEQGVAMLSSVLNSDRAILVNIQAIVEHPDGPLKRSRVLGRD